MANGRLPLFALVILPSLLGMVLISVMSWRLFGPAVGRSSDVALSVMEDMIKTTGGEVLSYPLAVGDTASVNRIVTAMASNALVFAVQVRDAEGNLIARAQNPNLPIEQGIQLIEYHETLTIDALDDELANDSGGVLVVGEALYQLTPHVLTQEKARLVSQYRLLIAALLLLGLLAIVVASRILWTSARSITRGLKRIGDGETAVTVDTASFVTEFETIRRGVNRLAQHVDDARSRQAQALTDLEAAVDRAEASEQETRAFYAIAAREIADPVKQLVEQLTLNQQNGAASVDPATILATAQKIQLSVLAMLGRLKDEHRSDGDHAVAIEDVINNLKRRYQARFDLKGVAFHVEQRGAQGQPNHVIDSGALATVLEKLLDNALAFTPEGEVRLCWSVTSGDDAAAVLTVTVRDNGIGIDEAHASRIFDRYTHFDQTVSGELSSGLGLYIAQSLTARLGGALAVVSQRGVGSEFTLRLPIKRGSSPPTDFLGVGGTMALTVGVTAAEQSALETRFAANEIVDVYCDTGIEALALLAQHPVDMMLVDEALADIEVERFVDEARKRRPSLIVAVLSETPADFAGADLTLARPVTAAAFRELLRAVVAQTVTGVDYRLLERWGAPRDTDPP